MCAGGSTCGQLPVSVQGACPTSQACNAAGACGPANGQTCDPLNDGTDCASGFCSGGDDFCCSVACTGPCASCAGGTTCGLLAEGSQGACQTNQACNAAGACEAVDGQACSQANNGGDCASGFCSGGDNVCCNVACPGPCASCASGTTCGLLPAGSAGACGTGKVCNAAGACIVGPTGSGTASDPYTTTPPLAKCSAYLSAFPTTPDGVYTIDPGTGAINVYCDMVHGGITYASFGFGQYSGSYPGWAQVGAPDFLGTTEFDAAFSYLYDRNGGLVNLQVGFSSSNCCITDTTQNSWYGLAGNQYMYPYEGGNQSCNPGGGYMSSIVQIGGPSTLIATITPAEAGTVQTFTSCGISDNPAIFVQRY
jgi:hypothetical protein